MRIKSDFVTNSSSTSYILATEATYVKDGEEKKIYNDLNGSVPITYYALKILEAELQIRFSKDIEKIDIIYEQYVDYFSGDGWDGGDYNFAGPGYRFFGDREIAKKVLNKKDIKLIFENGVLSGYPEDWKYECEQEVIEKKYNIE